MPEQFDPYRKWLGIPREEQPPHYYRLLGLAPFEHDPDVIENAADQRMAHVRTFQSGQNGPLSQRILNELSAAKVCLLNADKKAAYDGQLRARISATSRHAELEAASKNTAIVPAATQRWPDWKLGVLIGSIVSSVVLVVGGAMILAGGKQDVPVANVVGDPPHNDLDKKPPDNQGSGGSSSSDGNGGASTNTTDKPPPSDPNKGNTKPPVDPQNTAPKTPDKIGELPVVPFQGDKDPKEPPNPPKDPVKTPTPDPTKTPPKTPTPTPSVPQFELTPVTDLAVDLLKLIDPKKHSVVGEWKLDNDGVVSGNARPILQLPCMVPPEYVLSLVVQRRDGTEEFDIGLVSGDRQFIVVLGRSNGYWSGLENVDNLAIGLKNPTIRTFSNLFHGGSAACVQAMVLKGRVVIIVDGERIVDWSGEPRRLTSSLKLPGGQPGLFLSTNQSSFAVSKLVIASLMNGRLPLPSDGDLPTAEARAKKLIPEPAKLKLVTREERLRLATDLYARANLAFDDRPLQFVLLREALNLAVEAGNMEWAWKIAQDQALWFPVDASEKIADAVERAKKATLPPEVSHAIADGALWLADEAVADSSLPPMDRLSATDRLLAAAKVFSSRKPEAQLTKEQTAREVWGRLQHRESDAAKKSQETLDTSPDDADANMSLGRYYVTSGGDWERALPCFVKSSSEWKDAAQRDAASPKLPDRQVAVADDWYKLAQSLKKDDPLAARCYRRARFWYEEALPNLQGTAKTSVERRLSDISAGTGLAAKIYAAPSGVINLQQLYKARVDHLVDFAWKTEPPDPAATNNNYIIRWNGWLDVPKAGQYTLVTDSHYFIRLKLDGELIMDAWAPHPPRVDSSRYLLSKPYSLEIEYYNNANGHMRLLWRQDCGFPEQVIAADYLFLQREQAAKALPGLR